MCSCFSAVELMGLMTGRPMHISTAPVKPSSTALSLSLAVFWSVVCCSVFIGVNAVLKTALWFNQSFVLWFIYHVHLQEDDTVVNVQCGYRTLNASVPEVRHTLVYTLSPFMLCLVLAPLSPVL